MTIKKLTVCQQNEIAFDGKTDDYEIVEAGDWIVGKKWEVQTFILKAQATGKFYRFSHTRSGADHSGYMYDVKDSWQEDCELEEVINEVTFTTKWIPVGEIDY